MNYTPGEQLHHTDTIQLDFNALFQAAAPTLIILPNDPVYTIVHANDKFLRTTNSTIYDLVGHGVFQVFPQNPTEQEIRYAETVHNSFKKVITEKVHDTLPTQRYDIPVRGTDQFETRYWEGANSPVLDARGNVAYIIHTVVDITGAFLLARNERIALEVAEEKRKALYKLFKEAPAGICVFEGPEFVFQLVNPTYQAFFPGRELCYKPLLEALPELKGHPLVDGFKKVYQTGETYEGKEVLTPLVRSPGGQLENSYWNFTAQARYNEQGKINGVLMFGFEVTEQVLARQQIQESEERLNLAVENTHAGVFDVDLSSGITIRSLQHARIFGYQDNSEEWTIEKMESHILPEDLERVRHIYQNSLKTGVLNNELRIRRADGAVRLIKIAGKIYYDHTGAPARIIGTVIDNTDQKAMQRQKDEFISTVSHELKTPVTSIKAYSQILKKSLDNCDSKNQAFLQRMEMQINRLESLINGLLEVTRIESGKLLLSCSSVDLNLLVSELIIDLQLITSSHQLVITETVPLQVYADKERLSQVISNLVTNAVKYSPNADRVHVSLLRRDNKCIFSIKDFGVGIPDEQKPLVFERFHQVNKSDMNLGLGLGLYISKEIITMLGGEIWFESKQGEGSTFYFSLPCE